jgi:hypothetical protein
MQGKLVRRKAGWDTHGLPIELAVEKKLGITKEDIGKKLTIEEYNQACREDVMKFTGIWNDLTEPEGGDSIPHNALLWVDGKFGTSTTDSRRWWSSNCHAN